MGAEVDEDLTFEERVAVELLGLALDHLEGFDEEDKDDVLLEIFSDALSKILFSFKIMNPAFTDASILAEIFDKIRSKYKVRAMVQIIKADSKELN
jgi:hypothetical protein